MQVAGRLERAAAAAASLARAAAGGLVGEPGAETEAEVADHREEGRGVEVDEVLANAPAHCLVHRPEWVLAEQAEGCVSCERASKHEGCCETEVARAQRLHWEPLADEPRNEQSEQGAARALVREVAGEVDARQAHREQGHRVEAPGEGARCGPLARLGPLAARPPPPPPQRAQLASQVGLDEDVPDGGGDHRVAAWAAGAKLAGDGKLLQLRLGRLNIVSAKQAGRIVGVDAGAEVAWPGPRELLGALLRVPVGPLAGQQPLEDLVGPLGKAERHHEPVRHSLV